MSSAIIAKYLKIAQFILIILFLIFESNTALCNNQNNKGARKEYIFISDTQEMLNAEYLWNISNNNLEMTEMMFEDIVKRNPRAVYHMGDLVAEGYVKISWNTMDKFLEQLEDASIPFNPVMGNHELIALPKRGEKNFQIRFPHHSRTGYSVKVDSLTVILLNSNFGNMSDDEISEQNEWYKNELIKLDEDTSVHIIAVGTHYSPYTNSSRVAPSETVQQLFVPGFVQSSKAKIFFSGHSHAFEHFIVEEKDFLVIGGGGGPQQPLLMGDKSRFEDQFKDVEKYRRFHFVSLTKETDGYLLTVIMVDPTYSFLEEAYQIKFEN